MASEIRCGCDTDSEPTEVHSMVRLGRQRLALDLKDAREEIAELERQLAERGTYADGVEAAARKVCDCEHPDKWSVHAPMCRFRIAIRALKRPAPAPTEAAQPTSFVDTERPPKDKETTRFPMGVPTPAPASGVSEPMKIWECKIGEIDRAKLPSGSDYPMRQAVVKAYREITGEDALFCFSGWAGELTESERAVVENRMPKRATAPPAANVGAVASRPETGPMRFENDWCGLFIRGDSAFGWAMYLESFVRNPQTSPYKKAVQGLVEFLRSCDEGEKPEAQLAKLQAALPGAEKERE